MAKAAAATAATSAPLFKIYVIHSAALTIRLQKFKPVIDIIKTSGQKAGYKVEVILITGSDPSVLQPQLEELQKKVSYDPTGNQIFDQCIQVLSLEMISNIEKHKEALRKIAASKTSDENGDLHLVLEDDAVILKDCIDNFEDVLKVNHKKHDWDVIIMGLSKTSDGKVKQELENLNELTGSGKILPSKEAYFIRKNVATNILPKFETYKFTYRIQLSWIINEGVGDNMHVYYPRKRTTIDGSKLGLFPSSIHTNNILTYNNEYMQLYKFLSVSKEDIIKNMSVIDSLYKTVKTLNSPDFTHLYGLLKIKVDLLEEGEKILLEAIDQMRESQGILNSRSDLANNLVELYQHLQHDIKPSLAKPSKYANVKFRNDSGVLV